MKQVLFVTEDKTPRDVFRMLSEELLKHDISGVLRITSEDVRSRLNLRTMVEQSDYVMVGMSCSPVKAKEEMEAIDLAKKFKKPIFVFADNYEIADRPYFKPYLHSTILCVIDEYESRRVSKKLPNTQVVSVGSPSFEQRIKTQIDGDEVRKRLKLSPGPTIIYSGLKSTDINISSLNSILDALWIGEISQANLLFVQHEKEPKESAQFMPLYDQMLKNLEGSKIQLRIFPNENEYTHLQLLKASDLLISRASGLDIIAVYWRIPTIDFFNYTGTTRYIQQTGGERWFLSDCGATKRVDGDSSLLSTSIIDLFNTEETKRRQRQYQEMNFPMSNWDISSLDRMVALFK